MAAHKVLITGIRGFIGQHLAVHLFDRGYEVFGTTREGDVSPVLPSDTSGYRSVNLAGAQVGMAHSVDLGSGLDWGSLYDGMDTVIHLAARVHVRERDARKDSEFHHKVNLDGTLAIARNAASNGVHRFIYMSTAGVYGHVRQHEHVNERSALSADTPYANAKLKAEAELRVISKATGMEIVIIRPPLVYGPGLKGNFLTLLKLVSSGVPCPFGAVHNRRSFINIENLVDFIRVTLERPEAIGETFLVADREALSTPDWMRQIAKAMGTKSIQVSLPPWVLRATMTALGQRTTFEKLCEDFVIDASKAKKLLDWEPSVPAETGIVKTVRWFQHRL